MLTSQEHSEREHAPVPVFSPNPVIVRRGRYPLRLNTANGWYRFITEKPPFADPAFFAELNVGGFEEGLGNERAWSTGSKAQLGGRR